MNKIGQKVKVVPCPWRKQKVFIGKIRENTYSGAYISRMIGKKNASLTSVYFGNDEIFKL